MTRIGRRTPMSRCICCAWQRTQFPSASGAAQVGRYLRCDLPAAEDVGRGFEHRLRNSLSASDIQHHDLRTGLDTGDIFTVSPPPDEAGGVQAATRRDGSAVESPSFSALTSVNTT